MVLRTQIEIVLLIPASLVYGTFLLFISIVLWSFFNEIFGGSSVDIDGRFCLDFSLLFWLDVEETTLSEGYPLFCCFSSLKVIVLELPDGTELTFLEIMWRGIAGITTVPPVPTLSISSSRSCYESFGVVIPLSMVSIFVYGFFCRVNTCLPWLCPLVTCYSYIGGALSCRR